MNKSYVKKGGRQTIHIDIKPIADCLSLAETYGEICIKCNKCGRFDYGGVSNPVRSEIKIISQKDDGIPPGWKYPEEELTYFRGKWQWRSARGKNTTSQQRGTLEETLPPAWYPERLPYLRWWIEGKNY